ncbi:MAG: inositol 2-dehydrogenase [Chitinophagaceae bacterium]|nr:inositol 2-dehydrogenase [Chitinophagaceae bacterium]
MQYHKPVHIALIGLGRMGKIHLRHLLNAIPGASVAAVSDTLYIEDNFRNEFGNFLFTNHPTDAIARPEVDAVVICTPTSSHAALVEEAIEAGKHVFCEKPLDLSLEVTKKLLRKAEEAGLKLMVGFNRRFDPDFLQARQSTATGRIGNLQIIKITNRDPAIPPIEFIKTSGGMFMDFSIHDIDMARYIMNKKVVEVYAKGLVFMDKAVEEAGDIDTALITLTFEDGTYAVIDNSRKAVYGYDQRLEVFGDGGMIQVENNLYHRNIVFDSSGIHQALPLNSFTERYIQSYLKEMELFVDAVGNNTGLPVSHEDIIMATIIAYAARQSMKEGSPVSIR